MPKRRKNPVRKSKKTKSRRRIRRNRGGSKNTSETTQEPHCFCCCLECSPCVCMVSDDSDESESSDSSTSENKENKENEKGLLLLKYDEDENATSVIKDVVEIMTISEDEENQASSPTSDSIIKDEVDPTTILEDEDNQASSDKASSSKPVTSPENTSRSCIKSVVNIITLSEDEENQASGDKASSSKPVTGTDYTSRSCIKNVVNINTLSEDEENQASGGCQPKRRRKRKTKKTKKKKFETAKVHWKIPIDEVRVFSDQEMSETTDEIKVSSDKEISETADEVRVLSDQEINETADEIRVFSEQDISETADEVRVFSDQEISEIAKEVTNSSAKEYEAQGARPKKSNREKGKKKSQKSKDRIELVSPQEPDLRHKISESKEDANDKTNKRNSRGRGCNPQETICPSMFGKSFEIPPRMLKQMATSSDFENKYGEIPPFPYSQDIIIEDPILPSIRKKRNEMISVEEMAFLFATEKALNRENLYEIVAETVLRFRYYNEVQRRGTTRQEANVDTSNYNADFLRKYIMSRAITAIKTALSRANIDTRSICNLSKLRRYIMRVCIFEIIPAIIKEDINLAVCSRYHVKLSEYIMDICISSLIVTLKEFKTYSDLHCEKEELCVYLTNRCIGVVVAAVCPETAATSRRSPSEKDNLLKTIYAILQEDIHPSVTHGLPGYVPRRFNVDRNEELYVTASSHRSQNKELLSTSRSYRSQYEELPSTSASYSLQNEELPSTSASYSLQKPTDQVDLSFQEDESNRTLPAYETASASETEKFEETTHYTKWYPHEMIERSEEATDKPESSVREIFPPPALQPTESSWQYFVPKKQLITTESSLRNMTANRILRGEIWDPYELDVPPRSEVELRDQSGRKVPPGFKPIDSNLSNAGLTRKLRGELYNLFPGQVPPGFQQEQHVPPAGNFATDMRSTGAIPKKRKPISTNNNGAIPKKSQPKSENLPSTSASYSPQNEELPSTSGAYNPIYYFPRYENQAESEEPQWFEPLWLHLEGVLTNKISLENTTTKSRDEIMWDIRSYRWTTGGTGYKDYSTYRLRRVVWLSAMCELEMKNPHLAITDPTYMPEETSVPRILLAYIGKPEPVFFYPNEYVRYLVTCRYIIIEDQDTVLVGFDIIKRAPPIGCKDINKWKEYREQERKKKTPVANALGHFRGFYKKIMNRVPQTKNRVPVT